MTSTKRGQTLSQWSLAGLDAAADRALEDAHCTTLAASDFGGFCSLLDEPAPRGFQELLSMDPQWG